MEGAPESGSARPPAEQVTRDDLRGLRRWVVVVAVWAVAATAVGLIALLDTSADDSAKRAGHAEARVARAERVLDKRIDDLESSLADLPQAGDVTRLQTRLARAEDDASKAAGDAKSADQKVTDLEDRVKQLEDASRAAAGTGGKGKKQP